jgi:hypothetical protein
MRMLRYLLSIALVFALCARAKADDFQMVVVDPPPTFTFYDLTSLGTPFTLSWGNCAPGEVPSGSPTDGCISLLNGTGKLITSLEVIVPDTDGVVGQTAGCPTANSLFPIISCPPNPVGGFFDINFSGGNITPGMFFVLAEGGVPDPTTFPDVTAIAGAPEPSSLWLLSTGILSVGFFFTRRQRALGTLRP